MKKLVLVAATAALATMPAFAIDYRWTSGFGQGTFIAIIRNGDGGSISIYCPAGQVDTTPGIFVESRKINLKAKRPVDIQVVVGGKNFAFTGAGNQVEAKARGTRQDLWSLSNALAESRASAFIVEFPSQKTSERFSLLNARDALMDGGKSIVDPCT